MSIGWVLPLIITGAAASVSVINICIKGWTAEGIIVLLSTAILSGVLWGIWAVVLR